MKIISAQEARSKTESVLNVEKYLEEIEARIYESINEGRISCFKIIKNIRDEFSIARLIREKLLELGYEVNSKVSEENNICFEIKW